MPMLDAAVNVASYRAETEDRAEIFFIGTATILVVADGAGGRPGGAAAADGVVRWVRQHAPRIDCRNPRGWCNLLADADHVLQRDAEAGETTAVVLAVSPDGIAGASAGDSEAWLIGSERHLALTGRQHAKPFLGTGMAKPVPFQARRPAGTLL